MGNILYQTVIFLILSATFRFSQGLHCFSCAHIESGDLELISGFENVTLDDSCKWGREPKYQLLAYCGDHEEVGFSYDYICMETKLTGYLKTEATQFNGTLWGCAIRRLVDNAEVMRLYSEFRQGKLSVISRTFQDLTGKEYLENLTSIFDESLTTIKVLARDVNFGCWKNETDEESPGTEAPGDNSGSKRICIWSYIVLFSYFIVFY